MAAIHTISNRRAGAASDALDAIETEQDDEFFLSVKPRTQIKQLQTAAAVTLTQSHYRRASDSFAIDADGFIHCWNGIDKPLRFDPAIGSFETAGVIAPTTPISMGFSGRGNIVGEFYAYCRFIDRSGNMSSLSPISTMLECWSSEGTVTAASYASPIVITSSSISGLGDGQIVKISGIIGNTAANGIYSVRKLTSTTAELYADSSLTVPVSGNATYISGGKIRTGVSTVTYANVPVSSEDKVVRRQILRNQDGDTSVFYVDIDTEDLTSTSFNSNTDSISLIDSVSLFDVNGKSLVDKTVPMSHKRYICFHRGRLFAAGGVAYQEGAVSVTNGSYIVTGIGTEWGPITFADRVFEVQGGTKQYRIDRLTSTTSLILTEPYEGTTDAYAYYSIHNGEGERRTIYWSEAAEVEAWPIDNSVTIAEDPQAGEITGLMPMRSWVYILCEQRLFRLSYVNDPLLDGDVTPAVARGCVNNRCWVQVEDIAFCLDRLGIHAFAGNDDQDIGTPAIQDLFRQKPAGRYKINWEHRENFHAVYSNGEGTIRWFVCLNGSPVPQHAICYNIRLKRWWIEEYPWEVGASCIGRIRRQPQVFLGIDSRRVMAVGHSTLDGIVPNNATVRGTVTSSSVAWIADSTATFPACAGYTVTIVRGKGKGQRRRIVSVSSTKLYVDQPWLDKPDTTSVYQIGAIGWNWKSGWLRWAASDANSIRAINLQFKPQASTSEVHIRVYRDMADTAQSWERPVRTDDHNGVGVLAENPDTDVTVDPLKTNGYVVHRMDGFREHFTDASRFVAIEVGGYSNADQTTLFRMGLEGAQG